MTQEDVLTLSKAGFTADQIMMMAQLPTQQPTQQMVQPQVQQPAQQMVQPQMMQPVQQMVQPQMMQPAQQMVQPQMYQPVQQMVQPQVQQPAQPVQFTQPQGADPFKSLFEQMTGIKQAIQSNNIQNSVIQTQPQNTDDILASIIQPTKPNKEETQK